MQIENTNEIEENENVTEEPQEVISSQTDSQQTKNDEDAREPKALQDAKKYRKRAQDAETERDSLREKLEGFQRQQIENLLEQKLQVPKSAWAFGLTIEAVTNSDGSIDSNKVFTWADEAKQQHGLAPHAVSGPPSNRPVQLRLPNSEPVVEDGVAKWRNAMRAER